MQLLLPTRSVSALEDGTRGYSQGVEAALRSSLLPRTSENSTSETVWKIAENVSARLSGGKKRPNWDSFHPSWPLSEPRFETYPEFPNSFGRGILRSS